MSELIRRFRYDDIDFATAQTAREGWDNAASWFGIHIAHDPRGCFIAAANGHAVGMITTTRFRNSTGTASAMIEGGS